MALHRDDPDTIAASQDRIAAAVNGADGVSYSTCTECSIPIMHVYSLYGGWLWLAAAGQGNTPPAQCPDVPGLNGIGHGAHKPQATS